jgi:hypothetical protein
VPGKEYLDRDVVPLSQSLIEWRIILDRMGNYDRKPLFPLFQKGTPTIRSNKG